jgi:hypothetical protein
MLHSYLIPPSHDRLANAETRVLLLELSTPTFSLESSARMAQLLCAPRDNIFSILSMPRKGIKTTLSGLWALDII